MGSQSVLQRFLPCKEDDLSVALERYEEGGKAVKAGIYEGVGEGRVGRGVL